MNHEISKIKVIVLAIILLTAPLLHAVSPNITKVPNAKQQALINRGYGMFIHFGVNTFNQAEWSDGNLPALSYNPTKLDCDQWVQTAKEAGFRYIILITKHHDGFCLWDSKYTTYDVASSLVKTDVVAEVSKACKKYGIQLGLYYSLWDRHEPTHRQKDPTAYVEFMKNQLTELLTNYGPICEIWFDGGWAKPDADWNFPAIYKLVNKIQPQCAIASNHTIGIEGKAGSIQQPEDYKEGNPIRFWPTDFRLKDPNLARWDDPKLYRTPTGENVYMPFEHTICLSDHWNWFQKREVKPARSLDELEELYYWCTSNDNVLIINIPPDQTGRIRLHERERIIALADRLGIRGGDKPLPSTPVNQAFLANAHSNSVYCHGYQGSKAVDFSLTSRWASRVKKASLTLSPQNKKEFKFDRIAIHEFGEDQALPGGFSTIHFFRVQEYTIDIYAKGEWHTAYFGTTIGAAKVINFPEILTAEKIRLRILKATKPASIKHFSVSRRDSIGLRQ